MNFLAICQETDRILASQGVILSTITTGYQDLLVGYVANAYMEIQNLRQEWNFLHTDVTITLTQGKSDYSIFDMFGTTTDPVANWELSRFVYNNGSRKVVIKYVPYEQYVLEDWAEELEPTKFTKRIEDNALIFNSPDAAYSILAHYFMKGQILVDNTDIPLIPREHVSSIYYQAAADIALKLGFIEVYQLFSTKASISIGSLLRKSNPSKTVRTRGIV